MMVDLPSRERGNLSHRFREVRTIVLLKELKRGYVSSQEESASNLNWLVVSTHLKNMSQNGSFPQVGVKIQKIFETTTQ